MRIHQWCLFSSVIRGEGASILLLRDRLRESNSLLASSQGETPHEDRLAEAAQEKAGAGLHRDKVQ